MLERGFLCEMACPAHSLPCSVFTPQVICPDWEQGPLVGCLIALTLLLSIAGRVQTEGTAITSSTEELQRRNVQMMLKWPLIRDVLVQQLFILETKKAGETPRDLHIFALSAS